ncbi:MAG: transcription elongation factor GreA [Candidatus Pacebacteria bacterium]|nr:transcription elongation factor GreA [Candidatus Paceibacterota bacterium]
MTDKVQISQERKIELEAELFDLKSVKRPEILERLQYAKSLGDLSENAEYHAARETQGRNEDRIKEIEAIIKNAQIVEKTNSDTAQITSVVTVQKEGEKEKREFTLVGIEEADMSTGKLSIESPIGQALLDKKKGDTAEVETPGGIVKWKIVSIK